MPIDRRFASPQRLGQWMLLAWLLLPTTSTTVNAEECFRVAFAQDTLANDWRRRQVQELAETLAPYSGICFSYSDASGDSARHALNIERHVASGLDLLVTSPRDNLLLEPVISKVHRSGIPVVLLSRSIESNNYSHFIAADDWQIGRLSADYIARALATSGRARVVILQGVPTSSTAIARTRAFLDRLQATPSIEVVAIRPANYLRSDAIKAMEELLSEGTGFEAIYAQSDSMAAGARMALRRAGIDPATIVITGIDYISEAREAIREGLQAASFTYPTGGREGAEVILKRLKGETPPRRLMLDSIQVTRHNVEQVAPIF